MVKKHPDSQHQTDQNRVYINGARAELSARTSIVPNSIKKIIIGASHHFFRALRNPHNSPKIDSLDIILPLPYNHFKPGNLLFLIT